MEQRSKGVNWKSLCLVLGIGFAIALVNQILSPRDEFGAPAASAWFVLLFGGLCSANTIALTKSCAWHVHGPPRPLWWRVVCSAIAGATLAFWQVGLAWFLGFILR